MAGLSVLMLAAMSSYYILLAAIPAQAAISGGARAAGFATATLMASTIVGELVAPRLVSWLGRRGALVLALAIMGASCLAAFSVSMPVLLSSCVARGLGVGILLVAACGMAAQLAPEGRRAEAMSIYGVASAIPSIICVPLGPWMLIHLGASLTASAACLLTAAGIIVALVTPQNGRVAVDERHSHRLPEWRVAAWPSLALAIGAVIVGATITFLPLAHPEVASGTIMLALLVQGLCATGMRYLSARHIDRKGTQRPMVAGVLMCIAALVCLSFSGEFAVLAGMILSGCAFGILQSATLAELLARAHPAQADGAGAVWNAAYDAGLGVGGLAIGMLAASTGYGGSFLMTSGGLAILALIVFYGVEMRRST
jgi:predicted MFS family arabinose efflux permease